MLIIHRISYTILFDPRDLSLWLVAWLFDGAHRAGTEKYVFQNLQVGRVCAREFMRFKYIYIYMLLPHVPTLFGLETLEHGYFRSRTCTHVPRQSASVQQARTLWTAYGKPKSRILELLLLKF